MHWKLAGDLGRRYGAVSGDRNPIHLYPLTAKAFGFPTNIAHGMWTLARSLSALQNKLAGRIHGRGRVPQADLPARARSCSAPMSATPASSFGVKGSKKPVTHLVGQITPRT